MKRALLLAVVLSAAACGRTDAVKKYESWADDACACTDAACATKMETQLNEMAKKYTGVKMQRADSEAIQAAGQRGAKCLLDTRANAPK